MRVFFGIVFYFVYNLCYIKLKKKLYGSCLICNVFVLFNYYILGIFFGNYVDKC